MNSHHHGSGSCGVLIIMKRKENQISGPWSIIIMVSLGSLFYGFMSGTNVYTDQGHMMVLSFD